jgi:dihydrodipicolinate synthase/N-acetylneuraminate lyase
MTERAAPPGILPALITPFRDDQTADLAPLKDVIDFLLERGVHGLFALGTTGEGPLLEPAERREVAEFVLGHVGDRVPVVVHCGAPDTRTTADLARHAEANGAAGVAVVVPYYFRAATPELFRHFSDVAKAAPRVSHYVYENPERVGYSAGVKLVARLVNGLDNVVGVKDTGDTIGKITDYLTQPGRPIQVYVGNNSTIFPALVVGARGSVSALANAVPELVTAIHERWEEGRTDEARQLQYTLARLNGALEGSSFVGAVKHLVRRRGLPAGLTRPPVASLTPDEALALDRRLAAFDDLGPWLEPVGPAARR